MLFCKRKILGFACEGCRKSTNSIREYSFNQYPIKQIITNNNNWNNPINLDIFSSTDYENKEYDKKDFGMIPWKHCKLILLTYHLWLPALKETAPD